MRNRIPGLAFAGLVLIGGAGALAQAEAERRLDAAIERLRAVLGPEARLEIGGRRADPVTGNVTLSDVVLTQGSDRYTMPEIRLADVAEARIGHAELLRPRHAATDGSGASGTAERVVIGGLVLPPAGKRLDLADLVLDALEVEALRGEAAGKGSLRLDRLALREASRSRFGAGTLEGLEYAGQGADPQSFRLGRVALEGLVLPFAGDDFDPLAFRAGHLAIENASLSDPGQGVSLALGRLDLRDWLPGRTTTLAVEGVQLGSPAAQLGQIEMSLVRLDASGIDAARSLAAVMEGVQVPDPLPGTPQRLVMEGLDAALDGQPVFTLARLLTEGELENGIARGALATEGLRITPPPGQADWLDGLGYREIAGGLELRGSAPRAGGRLEIAPLSIAWNNAVSIGLSAQVDGMPAAPAEGTPLDPEATAAQMMAARLAGLTLTLRDHGLLGRVLAQQAREQRIPEARLREQWAQMALAMPLPGVAAGDGRRRGPAAKGTAGADPLAPMRQAVATFIRQPGTLEIALRPPKPLAFANLGSLSGNPAEAVRLLGLSIVAR
jgi:hypothetical protein